MKGITMRAVLNSKVLCIFDLKYEIYKLIRLS